MCKDHRNPRERDEILRLRRLLEAESTDGLRLLHDLKDNPICSVILDDTVPCVAVSWKRYAPSAQLRFVHERIIDLLGKHSLNKLLGDDTALPTIHAEDETWITENWMPRAIAGGLKLIANKRPASYFGRLAVDNIKSGTPAEITLCSFDDLVSARQSLRDFGRQPVSD